MSKQSTRLKIWIVYREGAGCFHWQSEERTRPEWIKTCSIFGRIYIRSTVTNTSEICTSVCPRVDLSIFHSARHLHTSAQTEKEQKIARVALTLGEGHLLWIDFTHAQYPLANKTASWTDAQISQNAAPGKLVPLLWRGRIIYILVTKFTIKIKVIEKH